MHTPPSLQVLWLLVGILMSGSAGLRAAEVEEPIAATAEESSDAEPASYLQPQPSLLPRSEFQPEPALPPGAERLSASLAEAPMLGPSLLGQPFGQIGVGRDIVFGREAIGRVTTDAGDLLGASPGALGIGVQRRTPIVNDPRVRGSRVGQLAGSGSYWVPARIDLDTMLSKIDSRLLDEVTVIKGPYSARLGPGFRFLDIGLLHSPRFAGGPQWHGSTSFDFKTNGQPWYGRQMVFAGNDTWGVRAGYGHRTGNDYVSGGGLDIPSSYNSRDVDFALGSDLSADSSVEFNLIRLDQTNVEFPGMAFDMDYLVTDGYELEYVWENTRYFDRLDLETWYNRTRFAGDAQRPGKRRQFPFFDVIHYVGFTDVDSTSTGFSLAATWGEGDGPQLTAGVDLRAITQELNEIASGRIGFNIFTDANSPIPRSRSVNPGLFLEETLPVNDRLSVVAGARVDLTAANVIDDPAKLQALGLQNSQGSLADIVGSDDYRQNFATWATYLTARYELNPSWDLLLGAGHGERPPSLTELYAAQPFMFVLQNGENTVTGDPLLRPERLWQVDAGLSWHYERFRGGINGFHAWMQDYITFENLDVYYAPPYGQAEQVNLKYVNTKLATLVGAELFAEYDLNPWITPFATLQYLDGRDRTRNGEYATRQYEAGSPSVRVPGLARGHYSGIPGADAEPLPGISPLESRLGVRVHQPSPLPKWAIELCARVVDNQDRVATSLLETPTAGFTVWDLRGYWRARQNLLLLAGVENFTDKNYREHLDFRSPSGISVYQPGVNFYVGSELTY